MRRLDGKVILVAGGGGIGGEAARRYAEEGAGVVLGDIDLAGAEAVAEKIAKEGGRAVAVQLDGSEEESIRAAVARRKHAYGGLDGLHLNFASFADIAEDI